VRRRAVRTSILFYNAYPSPSLLWARIRGASDSTRGRSPHDDEHCAARAGLFDLRPMVKITANPGSGVSVDAGQKLWTTLAEEVRKELGLTAEYQWTWLQGPPRGKQARATFLGRRGTG